MGQEILDRHQKTFTSIYDRRIFFLKLKGRELKIEFTKYPFKQLKKPSIFNNLKVDSLLDIGANKLFSIFDRTEVKDFVDLYFILKKGFSMKYLRKNMQKKFGISIDPITLGSQIAKITFIKTIPDLLHKISLTEIKSALTDEALSLKKEIGY